MMFVLNAQYRMFNIEFHFKLVQAISTYVGVKLSAFYLKHNLINAKQVYKRPLIDFMKQFMYFKLNMVPSV